MRNYMSFIRDGVRVYMAGVDPHWKPISKEEYEEGTKDFTPVEEMIKNNIEDSSFREGQIPEKEE